VPPMINMKVSEKPLFIRPQKKKAKQNYLIWYVWCAIVKDLTKNILSEI